MTSFYRLISVVLLHLVFSCSLWADAYRFLALGDSLTAATRYQPFLEAQLRGGGYDFEWVGSLGEAPMRHQGVSGIGIDGINGNLQKSLDEAFGLTRSEPGNQAVVLLLVGINNMNHGLGIGGAQASAYPRNDQGYAAAPQFAAPVNGSYLNGLGNTWGDANYGTGWMRQQIEQLLGGILNHASAPMLVVSNLAPVAAGNPLYRKHTDNCCKRIEEYNAMLAEVVTKMAEQGKPVVIVDLYQAAQREYGPTPPNDWGDESLQSQDWVHPRPDSALWKTMAGRFDSGFRELLRASNR